MTKCHIAYVACAAALIGSGVAAAPPVAEQTAHAHHSMYVVRPGQSIQKAVDSARSGDTVLVTAGTYHESVKVTTPGLTLRGEGLATVLEPATPKTAKAGSHTAKAATKTGAKAAMKSCAELGNGICVVGAKHSPLQNVTISSLAVRGFAKTGVMAVGTDRLTVWNVTADRNGQWGIAEERATRSLYGLNLARNNGDAGLFLANTVSTEKGSTDTQGTLIEGNRLQNNRIGVTVRRLRNLTVAQNTVSGNCAAMFVVGDENTPKAGDLTIAGNRIVHNNTYCAKSRRLPFLQGSGIVLTGSEGTLVTRNVITGNTGTSPLSGGVVLFKSFVGVTNNNNLILANTLHDNSPADLVNQEGTRQGNTFEGNVCHASKPAGLC